MIDPYDQEREHDTTGGDPPDAGDGGNIGTIPPRAWDGSAANWGDFQGGMRCTICAIDWPLSDPTLFDLGHDHDWRFRETAPCPLCGEECRIFSNTTPISVEEAWSKVNHKLFAEYYERTRGRSVDED